MLIFAQSFAWPSRTQRNRKACLLLLRMPKELVALENNLTVGYKLKHSSLKCPNCSIPRHLFQKEQKLISTQRHMWKCLWWQYPECQNWKQNKMFVCWWMVKLWCVHTAEDSYSTGNQRKLLVHIRPWVNSNALCWMREIKHRRHTPITAFMRHLKRQSYGHKHHISGCLEPGVQRGMTRVIVQMFKK